MRRWRDREAIECPTNEMVLFGWAFDGFPIYYRYGHRDAMDATSRLITMIPIWRVESGGRGINNPPLVSSIATTPTGTPLQMTRGMFNQDYEIPLHAPMVGALDECNGRFGVTPEFPNGVYHYFITESYPYIPRCHWGDLYYTP